MQDLTPQGRQAVEDAARRHGVGVDAVLTLLRALRIGGGSLAQFNHPELGGMGQWSQGGMIMVGDMFNQGLKARVDALCSELAALLRSQSVFAAPPSSHSQSQSQSQAHSYGGPSGVSLFVSSSHDSGGWWPAELGSPASSGAQNSTRYAVFPSARRLAIQQGGEVTVYDTGDHHITGFSQSQGAGQSITFTSQHGLMRVADLPVVGPGPRGATPASGAAPSTEERSAGQEASPPPAPTGAQTPSAATAAQGQAAPVGAAAGPSSAGAGAGDPFTTLERLAELRQRGILTDEEFAAKKADILSRL